MGYKVALSDTDRERLACLLQLAEHAIGIKGNRLVPFTGEDIALAQKLRKMLEDTNEYIIITG